MDNDLTTPEGVLGEMVSRHGNVLGQATPTNPTTSDGKPNPNPIYRYTFEDGTQIDMDAKGSVSGATVKSTRADRAQPGEIRTNAQGQLVRINPDNSETVVDPSEKPTPAAKPVYTDVRTNASGQIIGVKADGSVDVIDSSTKPTKPAAAPKPIVRTVGGNLVETDPDGSNPRVLFDAGTNLARQEIAQIQTNGRITQAQIAADSRVNVAGIAAGSRVDVANINAGSREAAARYRGLTALDVAALRVGTSPNDRYYPSVTQNADGTYDVEMVPNKNFQGVDVGAVLKALYPQLADKVNAGVMTTQSAKDLLTAVHDAVTQQAEQQKTQFAQKSAMAQIGLGAAQKQADMAQTAIQSGVKLGVGPPMSVVKAQFAPFAMAKEVLASLAQSGSIDPSRVPDTLGLNLGGAAAGANGAAAPSAATPAPTNAPAPAAPAAPAPSPFPDLPGPGSPGPPYEGGPQPPSYAMGTGYAMGGPALVGEQGPEMVNVPRGSQILPIRRTRAPGPNLYSAPLPR